MNPQPSTSRKASAAFTCGLVTFGSGFLAIVSATDPLLLVFPVSFPLAILLGVLGLRDIRHSSGQLAGKALAQWGFGLTAAGFGLGFLLLPVG